MDFVCCLLSNRGSHTSAHAHTHAHTVRARVPHSLARHVVEHYLQPQRLIFYGAHTLLAFFVFWNINDSGDFPMFFFLVQAMLASVVYCVHWLSANKVSVRVDIVWVKVGRRCFLLAKHAKTPAQSHKHTLTQ